MKAYHMGNKKIILPGARASPGKSCVGWKWGTPVPRATRLQFIICPNISTKRLILLSETQNVVYIHS